VVFHPVGALLLVYILASSRPLVKGGRFLFCYENKKVLILIGKIKTNLAMVDKNDTISKGFTGFHSKMKL